MRQLLLLAAIALVPVQQPSKARVEGVVMRAGSNDPIVGARVMMFRPEDQNNTNSSSTTSAGNSLTLFRVPDPPALTGNAVPTPPPAPSAPLAPAYTDNGGKFAFPEVEAGTYRLLVSLDGFVRQEYGQRTFPGPGTPLTIHAGDVLKDLTIRLTPAGNVGGRIVDDFGKPAAGVPLQLLRAVYSQNAQRTLQNAGNAQTNDRGEYRFYWVTPGRYYLAAGTPQGIPPTPGNGTGSQNDSGDSYTFTYYPGVQDLSRANVVDIRPGSETVADFTAPKQQLYTIRGRLVDPSSATPPVSASIALAYQQLGGGNSMFSRNPFYNAVTGTFELRDVLPGLYLIFANTSGGYARMPIEVVNANIDGVVLTISPGFTVSGIITVEGGGPAPSAARVQLRPVVGSTPVLYGNLPSLARVLPDGTFAITGVQPGTYRIVPPSLPDFYTKEMLLDRVDALNQQVNVIQRGPNPPTLEIVMSPKVSQIDGVVSDLRSQPASSVRVVLIPDANRDRVELYKTATTDQAGRFSIRGIAPGDYKVFSWEELDGSAFFDPEVLRKAEPSGKSIRITEGSKQTVNLQVIPKD